MNITPTYNPVVREKKSNRLTTFQSRKTEKMISSYTTYNERSITSIVTDKKAHLPVKKKSVPTRNASTSVSFNENVYARPTQSLNDYTEAELEACWYNDDEYRQIKKDCIKIVKKMQQGKRINTRKYSVRGLEKYTGEAIERRELNKINAYIAVLDEQNRQLINGITDPKRIAKQYRLTSAKHCQEEASRKGEEDARAIRTRWQNKVSAKAA